MKTNFFRFLILGAVIFSFSTTASAATLFGDFLKEKEVEVSTSASLDFYNKYVWRGFLLDNDAVLQPSFTIGALGLEGGFWGSWDVDQDDGDDVNSDEVDFWVGYNFDLGFIDESLEIVGLSVGNTWYAFPGTDLYTTELYVTLAIDTILSPYFTWFYDYGDEEQGGADGNYYLIGFGHSFNLIEEYGVTLDLGAEVGFNDEFFIEGDGGYYVFTGGFTIPLTEHLTMTPSLGYSVPFGDLEDESDGAQDSEFFVGVSMGFDV